MSACASTRTPAASSPAANPMPGSTASSSAAIDCAKPATTVQQLVCSDRQLTDLDHRLQVAYQQALGRPDADKATLSAAQDSWAATRDDCAHNADVRTCVQEAYQTRLVQLALADPATVAPPVVTYRCPSGFDPLTAQFYNQFDPKTAVLNWKGDQYILFIQLSGSGARYGRQGVEYWEHQGEVRLDITGTTFLCNTA
ncbi:lysozyme inhibitor LprI family protein [Mycobacterium simiae]|uniref:lysozyme inhibitor LprI family protein n=1 Tax=Mycobacterium simiae TaxID=1784 RepID=UPI0021CD85A9|nr:lysozyme inhibitor LprI family protein [Mycobacterium simiae]